MRRQGRDMGRDQTERLMRAAGVRGVRRSKQAFTARRDPAASLPADLVQRTFTADAPRRLWVADILPLRALNMAAWAAEDDVDQLVDHADHGSNYLVMVDTDRIAELGAKPSTGTVGDSYDNAPAEAVNGLHRTELIRQQVSALGAMTRQLD